MAALALGVGVMALSGHAYAADDNNDETFEEKVIGGIMRGLGGTNMENTGIEYRERSPLVVPPKLDLPPPDSRAEASVPNWPKDPDVQRRKQAREASNKAKPTPWEAGRVLMPSELSHKSTGQSVANSDSAQPGTPGAALLSPSQLGFDGWSVGKLFGANKSETAPFTGEPTRESLTMPPTGYQTPSPNFAYGTGPKESLNREYNPAAGKY
jgi:hypothetical protein